MEWTHTDPIGLTERGGDSDGGYDPLGNYAMRASAPPQGQLPPQSSGAYYGPIYGGAGSSFTNAVNYSTGCRLDGAPADCNSVMSAANAGMARVRTISSPGLVDRPGLGFVTVEGGELKSQIADLLHLRGHVSDTQDTSSNPNCFVNAVPNSPGIARGYTFGHDGYHARGPGKVVTLPAMVGGEVKNITSGDTSSAAFNTIVDIAIPGGKYVALLKDLGNVKVTKGDIIKSKQVIGAVNGGRRDGFDMLKGLHFALIRAEYYDEYRRLTPHTVNPRDPKYKDSTKTINENLNKWFVDPLSDESPFNCPGIKTRIDFPVQNGQPTVYPIL